jgi:tetratricopeptide (TPR) repeat protein
VAASWSATAALLLLLPTLGVVGVHVGTLGADRYTYVPSLLVAPVAVATALRAAAGDAPGVPASDARRARPGHAPAVHVGALGLRRILTLVAAAAAAASWGGQTRRLVGEVWSGSEPLWRHSIAHCPGDSAAHSQLGVEVLGKGASRRAEALHALDAALALEPRAVSALLNRGVALQMDARDAEAARSFARAAGVNPANAVAQYNTAHALGRLGRTRESVERYELAVAAEPRMAHAWNNLGAALQDETGPSGRGRAGTGRAGTGRRGDGQTLDAAVRRRARRAADALARAVALAPAEADYAFNYGAALLRAGARRAATEALRLAERLKPGAAHVRAALRAAEGGTKKG